MLVSSGWSVRNLAVVAVLAIVSSGAGCATTGTKSLPSMIVKAPDGSLEPSEFREELTLARRVNVHVDLGRAYESEDDWQGAIDEYQKALDLAEAGKPAWNERRERDDLLALAHRKLGGVLDRAGRFDQAERQYKLAKEIRPKDAKIGNDLGYSYYMQGRHDEAEATLRETLKFAPNDSRVRTNLGLVLATKGQEAEAFDLLSEADGAGSAHLAIGYIQAANGRAAEARERFQKAQMLQPGLKPIALALARLDRDDEAVAGVADPGGDAAVVRASHAAPKR